MLSVPCTLVHADGVVEHTAFRMTAPKLATLEAKGGDAVDAFLRSKVTHKGYHGSWRRYGSWTLQDEGGEETYLFAWAYGKGAAPHAKCYTLDSDAMQVYDDVLLLRFPALDAVTLTKAMALTEPQVRRVAGLHCGGGGSQRRPSPRQRARPKARRRPRRRSQAKANTQPGTTAPVQLPVKDETAVFEVEEEGLLKDGSVATATFALADPANDDASGSDDDELPVNTNAATTAQSDDEDNDEDNDDEDDVADGPIDTALFDLEEADAEAVDDEDDDDAEPAVDVLEAHMLQHEDYEYPRQDDSLPAAVAVPRCGRAWLSSIKTRPTVCPLLTPTIRVECP